MAADHSGRRFQSRSITGWMPRASATSPSLAPYMYTMCAARSMRAARVALTGFSEMMDTALARKGLARFGHPA